MVKSSFSFSWLVFVARMNIQLSLFATISVIQNQTQPVVVLPHLYWEQEVRTFLRKENCKIINLEIPATMSGQYRRKNQ